MLLYIYVFYVYSLLRKKIAMIFYYYFGNGIVYSYMFYSCIEVFRFIE